MTEITFQNVQDAIFSAWRDGKPLPVQLEGFDFSRMFTSVKSAAQETLSESLDAKALSAMSPESFREAFVNSLDAAIRDFICCNVYPSIDEESERQALALSIVSAVKTILPAPMSKVIELIEPLLLVLVCSAIEVVVREGLAKYCAAQTGDKPLLFKVEKAGDEPTA